MKKSNELDVRGTLVRVIKIGGDDYVCLTDMAKLKSEDAQQTISNWMRNRMTLEYLGLWEELYNPDFKPLGFEGFRKEVGLNHFTMSPSKWIEGVNAIGIVAQSDRYGGTYARNDIAFKFAAWLSVEFELYLVKEFQRLKAKEQELIGWSAKRELAKINYRIHADAIQQNLIPATVTRSQMNIIYASEMRPRRRRRVARRTERGVLRSKIARGRADVLNVALFGMPQPNVSRIEHSEVVSFNTFTDYLMACGFGFTINLRPVSMLDCNCGNPHFKPPKSKWVKAIV